MIAVSTDTAERIAEWDGDFGPALVFVADPELRAIGAFHLTHSAAAPGGGDAARPATFVVGTDGLIVYARPASSVLDRPDPGDVFDALEAARR